MPSLGVLQDLLIERLYARSNRPGVEVEFTEEDLCELMAPDTGPPIVSVLVRNLLSDHLILQTRTDPIAFEINGSLLTAAEELQSRRAKTDAAERRTGDLSSRFDDVKLHVLYRVYRVTWESESGTGFNAGDIDRLAPGGTPRHISAKAIESLINDRLLEGQIGYFGISEDGIRRVDAELAVAGSPMYILNRRDTEAPVQHDAQENPDSEGKWEPLPLERDTPAYEDAIQAIENVVDRVKGDNGYAATQPDEHRSIVWSLEAGLDAIKNTLPTRSQVRELLLRPLKFLVAKFASAAIGELARRAAQALAAWAGLS